MRECPGDSRDCAVIAGAAAHRASKEASPGHSRAAVMRANPGETLLESSDFSQGRSQTAQVAARVFGSTVESCNRRFDLPMGECGVSDEPYICSARRYVAEKPGACDRWPSAFQACLLLPITRTLIVDPGAFWQA